MSHSNDVEEVYGALAAPSQLTSSYSYQNQPMLMVAYQTTGKFLTKMQVVRNGKWSPNRVHKWNAIQDSLELIKALRPIERKMCICKTKCTS